MTSGFFQRGQSKFSALKASMLSSVETIRSIVTKFKANLVAQKKQSLEQGSAAPGLGTTASKKQEKVSDGD